MNVDHKYVIIGQIYEQAWLGNQQLQALGAELSAEQAKFAELTKTPEKAKPVAAK